MMKKIFAIALVVSISFWAVGPVSATDAEDLQAQIDALLETIASLQAQIAAMGGGSGSGAGCMCDFTRNLYPGMSGDDVKCLQEYLNASGHQVAASGVGSPGSETLYFGSLTRAAVKSWQDANGIEYGAYWGYFGPSTQAVYNSVCGSGDNGGDDVIPPVEGSVLKVDLTADTPESTSVATGANANFTKVTFTAGDDDVSISKIYVTRSGLTANSDLENVKFYDMDGVYYGSIGSFNTNSKALITFTSKLVIEAGTSESYYIRAGFISTATAGKTASLGIASADDVICDSEEVTGVPINGNPMSVVSLTIGSATFAKDGSTPDSTPDIGDTDVVVNNFKITAGATESITVSEITALECGTAGLDDIENIELYDVTDSKTLGTVSSWTSGGKAAWTGLDISIDKGETHRFKIKVDIVDGAGLTTNADIVDGGDVLATVKGDTYGFFITPTTATTDWTTDYKGKGSSNQTINSGALTVGKSASSPATGNITTGDDQLLTVFDFTTKGEEIQVSALTLTFATTTGFQSYTEITNVKIYDENGDIVCGPKDLAAALTVAFTDTFIVPVGTHEYSIKAKISTDSSTLDALYVGINAPSTKITAKGMTSNESITAAPTSVVNGNTQTVAAGYLAAETLTSPVARSISKGQADYVWMTASLDAGASGEDVNVTAIVIEDSLNATATFGEISNFEIWADITTASSDRGDIYETRISDVEQPSGTATNTTATQSFTLNQTLTIPKGTFVKIAVVGDLSTTAGVGGTHTVRIDLDANDITASGADSGSTVSVTSIGAGQAMTSASGGALTVTVDSGSPNADILIGLDNKVTLAVFRLAASNIEDLDLDSFKITQTGVADAVDTFYFYASARSDGGNTEDYIAYGSGSTTLDVQIAGNTVKIPADDHVEITVKGDMKKVDGVAVVNNDAVEITIAAASDIDTTGLASQGTVSNTDTSVDGATHRLYESRPYFALNSSSPSGDLSPKANDVLMILDVTANDAEDINFVNIAASSSIIFQITDTIGGATSTGTWTLKDGDMNELATTSVDSGDDTTVTFSFATHDFDVPAGLTKKLYVYGDTTDYTTDGDVIQVWLDDAASDVTWSIDNAGDYSKGDIIFKGDIYGGSFVNPS